ncbi:hypothetical protein PHLGIDRAFT_515431 [Phlebiopsis gigantea 11061_1 CR5-6]|uniref:Uncharacterized protein n=1 Tax=Phlebiopsis gigantea (strain 11061_1 CR5-6) TaxID=745531 RepID=A0A0C3NN06_PHLG1|nr:hypothetical protein PHLGIDRAFT_515431 [Phlebiopsis gigantea 11061_1 CR5-6]
MARKPTSNRRLRMPRRAKQDRPEPVPATPQGENQPAVKSTPTGEASDATSGEETLTVPLVDQDQGSSSSVSASPTDGRTDGQNVASTHQDAPPKAIIANPLEEVQSEHSGPNTRSRARSKKSPDLRKKLLMSHARELSKTKMTSTPRKPGAPRTGISSVSRTGPATSANPGTSSTRWAAQAASPSRSGQPPSSSIVSGSQQVLPKSYGGKSSPVAPSITRVSASGTPSSLHISATGEASAPLPSAVADLDLPPTLAVGMFDNRIRFGSGGASAPFSSYDAAAVADPDLLPTLGVGMFDDRFTFDLGGAFAASLPSDVAAPVAEVDLPPVPAVGVSDDRFAFGSGAGAVSDWFLDVI